MGLVNHNFVGEKSGINTGSYKQYLRIIEPSLCPARIIDYLINWKSGASQQV